MHSLTFSGSQFRDKMQHCAEVSRQKITKEFRKFSKILIFLIVLEMFGFKCTKFGWERHISCDGNNKSVKGEADPSIFFCLLLKVNYELTGIGN